MLVAEVNLSSFAAKFYLRLPACSYVDLKWLQPHGKIYKAEHVS